jgi:thiol-disulfide isomerase/thioredoxin
VVAFWSTLNLDSERSEPHFQRLAEDFRGEGVRCAAVYVNGAPEEAGSSPYAVVRDPSGRLASLYKVRQVPRLFLVEDGTVRLTYDGFSPESYEGVRETLEDLDKVPS